MHFKEVDLTRAFRAAKKAGVDVSVEIDRIRYYFRRQGTKAIQLPGLPGFDEFMAAYARALAG